MLKPFVPLETAKMQARSAYREALERLKKHCLSQNETQFYERAVKVLDRTPIYWEKIGFLSCGRTKKYKNGRNEIVYEIIMNSNFLYSEDAPDFIKYTLIHELAHVIASVYDGTLEHNETFQNFDRILGGDGARFAPFRDPIISVRVDTSMRAICAPRRNLSARSSRR